MKKLYYVRTNGYDMLATYDKEEGIARFLNTVDVSYYLGHLNLIEDDSFWEIAEDVADFEEWLGIGNDSEAPVIIDSIDFE